MKKFVKRYKLWKAWSNQNQNDKFFKVLVLFNLAESPSFEAFAARETVIERLNAMTEFVKNLANVRKEFEDENKNEEEKED